MPSRHIRVNAVRFAATVAVALLATLAPCSAATAATTVNFWISNADAGPAAPVIYVPPGAAGELHIWARPQTDYRLLGYSLNLEAAQPGVMTFETVDVLNPQLDLSFAYRHQLVFDSETGLFMLPNEVRGFSGFSFFSGTDDLPIGSGLGPNCGIDPDCSTASGNPSWHIATVTYQAGLSTGSTELFLEIGEQGLWQALPGNPMPDDALNTDAVFGLANDAVHQWDVDPPGDPPDGDPDHRDMHMGAADAVIQIATADFDQDGDVDGADLLRWQRGLGVGATLTEGDADGNGVVNGVDLAVWRFQYGLTTAAVAVGASVPEPHWAAFLIGVIILSRARRARPIAIDA